VGLPETKNQQGRTLEETCCVHICISKQRKIRKNNEEGGDMQKKARLIIDNEKQDSFQFMSV